jgi:iron(III) transport system substrate-binding protein
MRVFAVLLALAGLAACGRAGDAPAQVAEASEVNVYSGRHYDSDIALFDAFTGETGVRVNLIEGEGDALIERLAREGDASPADIFMTADAGMLWRAEQRALFRPITDQEILRRVPPQYRHPDGLWVGLSRRARVVVYNKDDGPPEGLATYDDLAKPDFKGAICVRSSSNVYNQSLLASIVAHEGVAAAETWAEGVAQNFARAPQGNDTSQIEAVAAGMCRLAIVNTYYVARHLDSDDPKMRAIGEKIGVLFPNQGTTGTHVNISGAGVARYAPNPENAEKLIAFLLRPESQTAFARGNNEYPVVEGVAPGGPVVKLGTFRADTLDAAALGRNQPEAVRIFDRVGWP